MEKVDAVIFVTSSLSVMVLSLSIRCLIYNFVDHVPDYLDGAFRVNLRDISSRNFFYSFL